MRLLFKVSFWLHIADLYHKKALPWKEVPQTYTLPTFALN